MSKLEVLTSNSRKCSVAALPAQTLVPVPKLAIDPMLFKSIAVVVLNDEISGACQRGGWDG